MSNLQVIDGNLALNNAQISGYAMPAISTAAGAGQADVLKMTTSVNAQGLTTKEFIALSAPPATTAGLSSTTAGNFTVYDGGNGGVPTISANYPVNATVGSAVQSGVSTASNTLSGIGSAAIGLGALATPANVELIAANMGLGATGTAIAGGIAKIVPPVAGAMLLGRLGRWMGQGVWYFLPEFLKDTAIAQALNPNEWVQLAVNTGIPGLGLLTQILTGSDPDTGETYTYLEENQAYGLLRYMASQGVFASGTDEVLNDVSGVPAAVNAPIYRRKVTFSETKTWLGTNLYVTPALFLYENPDEDVVSFRMFTTDASVKDSEMYMAVCVYDGYLQTHFALAGDTSISAGFMRWNETQARMVNYTSRYNANTYTNPDDPQGRAVYMFPGNAEQINSEYTYTYPEVRLSAEQTALATHNSICWLLRYGDFETEGNIPDLGTVEGAPEIDPSSWTDNEAVKQYLTQEVPDLYADGNVVEINVPDADGNIVTTRYIKVQPPDSKTWYEAQPEVSPATATQGLTNPRVSPSLDPSAEAANQAAAAINAITHPDPWTNPAANPATETPDPTSGITANGSGSSPLPTLPSGDSSASALWSVYHVSRSALSQFGSWLWRPNTVEMFTRLMNDPMQAVISVHKLYGPIIDGESTTIMCGTVESDIPAHAIRQQYASIDLGTVNLPEHYGNVYDYMGTDIQIYLPFIGFVPLNNGDYMRGTIGLKYFVDSYTGTCLARIISNRDGETATLGEYTGNCAVEYPLTAEHRPGLFSGISSLVRGVGLAGAAIAAGSPAGVATLAAGAGAVGLLTNAAKTQYQRSGSLGSNAGVMGIRRPYLVISRVIAPRNPYFGSVAGHPTHTSGTIGSFSGFVQATEVKLNGIPATSPELNEIENLLKSGIYI